jgi:hypothetical protein
MVYITVQITWTTVYWLKLVHIIWPCNSNQYKPITNYVDGNSLLPYWYKNILLLCLTPCSQTRHSIQSCTIYQHAYVVIWGTAVAQWLRRCATNRKVTGSIPDGVTGIFH